MSEEALTAALQATFGFSSYRRLQLPVIQSVLRGQSTFAIMPTGQCWLLTYTSLYVTSCVNCEALAFRSDNIPPG